MSYRLDTGVILNKPYKHPQGHVRLDCYATKCGVFRYYDIKSGTHRDELRHPDQVFDKRSLATLGGVPATIGHPTERVTPKNFDRLGAGTVGDEIQAINPYVRVAVNVQREDAIEAIANGHNQVSLVYETQVVPESGTYEGIPYTHRQVGVQREDGQYIVYRELGLVQKGRAGDDVKLHLDGIDDLAIMKFDESLYGSLDTQKPMATIRLDNAQYEVDPAVATAINAHITKQDSALTDLQSKLQTEQGRATALLNALVKAGYESPEDALAAINSLKSQLEEAKGMATAATAEADAAKKEAETAQAEVGNMREMAAKQDAADKAKGILPADTKLDGLSSKEIKARAIAHRYPDIKLDELSDDALNGMWLVATRTDSSAPLRQVAQKATTETKLDAAGDARQKMSDRRMKKVS